MMRGKGEGRLNGWCGGVLFGFTIRETVAGDANFTYGKGEGGVSMVWWWEVVWYVRVVLCSLPTFRSCVSKRKLTFGPNCMRSPEGIVSRPVQVWRGEVGG